MDARTSDLLGALDGTAVEILTALLESPLLEKQLLERIDGATQSAVNKKLQRLKRTGLISRPPAGRKGRGIPWKVAEPQLTATLIKAVLSLATALDSRDQQERETTLRRLETIYRGSARLRIVGGNLDT